MQNGISSRVYEKQMRRLIIHSRRHRPDGKKKAFARLTPDVDALDIAATKLAIV